MALRPEQVRAACALLGWSGADLAARGAGHVNTISKFLRGRNLNYSSVTRIEETLRAAGVVFLEPDEHGGIGVRLRRSPA